MEMGEIDLKGAAATIADLLAKGWEEQCLEPHQMRAGDVLLADRTEFLELLAVNPDQYIVLYIVDAYTAERELFHLVALPVTPDGGASPIYRKKEGKSESDGS